MIYLWHCSKSHTRRSRVKGISRRHLLRLASRLPVIGFASALSNACARTAQAKSSDGNGPPTFIKGVWQQPAEKMALWKARGINTLFAVNGGGDVGLWTKEANKQDLYMVREPVGISYSAPKPSFWSLIAPPSSRTCTSQDCWPLR